MAVEKESKMMTEQEKFWKGSFGAEYNARNLATDAAAVDALYLSKYGITRSSLNTAFLGGLEIKSALEVGCNTGSQLLLLDRALGGRAELWGVDIQEEPLRRARELVPGLKVAVASARGLPFEDNRFDLVFTSGALIHVSPADRPAVMREIARVSRRWIWGFEYFAPFTREIIYRGISGVLWKANYPRRFLANVPGLRLVREKRCKYLAGENSDVMFLLEKEA